MDKNLAKQIKREKVGVMPTDTLYGLVGLALSEEVVTKIYQLKKRTPDKPFIILISSIEDLNLFQISLDNKTKIFLQKTWPNPVSVILLCKDASLSYLHRDTNTLAFRIPNNSKLLKLLQQTGPLVAPSANPEGEIPATTIEEAKKYFGDQVSFYKDGGKLTGEASTLISINNGEVKILRSGDYPMDILKI